MPQLQPGYRLDRYELLWPIAHGGMASVWAARLQGKHGFEKVVAVKTILPQLAGDPRFEKMFLDEAHLVAQIRHPNVAEILDVGEQDDVLYLVFEWIDGESLSTLRREVARSGKRFPGGVALRIVADACAGLHAAHELTDAAGKALRVVHRDVSPQNILISSQGGVKVIDFGVAKALNRVAGETNTGMLKGKVQYMAPEQAFGEPPDRRADVWGAGAVLYQLISGRLPYEAENPIASLHMLMARMPPAPLPAGLPAPVVGLIKQALALEKEKRFQTAAEMQTAVETVMNRISGPVTSSDVARFVGDNLAEKNEKRIRTIAAALEAAAARAKLGPGIVPAGYEARVEELHPDLGPGSQPSSPSSVSVPGQRATFSEPGRETMPSGAELEAAAAVAKAAAGRVATLAGPVSDRHPGALAAPTPLDPASDASLRTLGSAALEMPRPPPGARRRTWILVPALLAALAAAAAVALLVGLRRSPGPAAGQVSGATPAPQASSSPAELASRAPEHLAAPPGSVEPAAEPAAPAASASATAAPVAGAPAASVASPAEPIVASAAGETDRAGRGSPADKTRGRKRTDGAKGEADKPGAAAAAPAAASAASPQPTTPSPPATPAPPAPKDPLDVFGNR
jgi:serine/threonine-protein kinase